MYVGLSGTFGYVELRINADIYLYLYIYIYISTYICTLHMEGLRHVFRLKAPSCRPRINPTCLGSQTVCGGICTKTYNCCGPHEEPRDSSACNTSTDLKRTCAGWGGGRTACSQDRLADDALRCCK